MEDEELKAQTGSDEPSDDSLDDILGLSQGDDEDGDLEDSEEESDGDSSREEQPDKEEKKQRDFEKAFFKQKEENRRLKEQLKGSPAKTEDPSSPAPGSPEEEGIKLLQKMVSDALEPHLAPFKEQSERATLAEFKQKEYVSVLGDEIMAEYRAMRKTGDLSGDLESARLIAIGKNADKIVQAALETGRKDGYRSRDFKSGLKGPSESPVRGRSSGNLFEKYARGELSGKEIAEHQDEIDEWEAEQLGVSAVYDDDL